MPAQLTELKIQGVAIKLHRAGRGLNGEDGFLIEPGDAGALAAAVNTCWATPLCVMQWDRPDELNSRGSSRLKPSPPIASRSGRLRPKEDRNPNMKPILEQIIREISWWQKWEIFPGVFTPGPMTSRLFCTI